MNTINLNRKGVLKEIKREYIKDFEGKAPNIITSVIFNKDFTPSSKSSRINTTHSQK